ncbi:baseplate assembly protein [Pararhizobium haloflavum]|uniref:baseplate assembly protein n=1 Tax=Pararhizobium haloflavum TaxID=2037914 RepID=UPI000C189D05|nr:baseplate J/gp47 family protein [Pararhizobium haloflavum]
MSIDLSKLPKPNIIEEVDFEEILAEIEADLVARFPQVAPVLQTESAIVKKLIQAYATREMLMRLRINDATRAVLAPLSSGADLDVIAARQGLQRLVVTPAVGTTPAVMESDDRFLIRYMASFDRQSAGSAGLYVSEAMKAWPQLHDVRVNGFQVHGRRGDTDIVIIGPAGAAPTEVERALVSAAVRAPGVKPEAVSVAVIAAKRVEYAVDMVLVVRDGPDASVVMQEAEARIRAAGDARTKIGEEIPPGYLVGAAFGPSIISVRDLAPVVIPPDPYSVPVLTSINLTVEAQ